MKAAIILMFRDISLLAVPLFGFLAYLATTMAVRGPAWIDFLGAAAGVFVGMLFVALYEAAVK